LHEPFFRHQHEPPEGLRGYHQLRFLTTDPREEPPERWVEVFSFDVHGVSRELTVVEGSWLLEDDDHVLKIAFNDYCIVLEEAVLTLRGYAVQLPQWGPTQREDRELQLQAGQSCDSRPKWFPKLDRKRKLWARKADIMHQLDEEYLELAMDEDTRKPRPETSEYAQRILTELGDTFNSAATLGRIRKARENGWI